jgi:EAL domain-containing protein (putative c-di-GMP-specific phosphodiesterase class I)
MAYSFAFQPIVDTHRKSVVAYEALVRGSHNESALSVLSQYQGDDLLRFDGEARLGALTLASQLGLNCQLSLNILPASLELNPDILEQTLQCATEVGVNADELIIEISETEIIAQPELFASRIASIQAAGVRFSFDDFGAGYSGLNLLAEYQPHTIKLDRIIVQDIHQKGPRQAIVRGVLGTCLDLGIDVVAEGVETVDEYQWLLDAGINRFQGYLFSKPAFETLPLPSYPVV